METTEFLSQMYEVEVKRANYHTTEYLGPLHDKYRSRNQISNILWVRFKL